MNGFRTFRRWVSLAAGGLALVMASSGAASAAPDAGPGRGGHKADAMDAVEAMQPGWNLGNSLDAVGADETAWGNPRITEELLENVRAQGFNSIRIPVTWGQHQAPGDHALDPDHLDRVAEVVDWALDDGFWVMLNIHHDSWQWISSMPADREGVRARYDAMWEQLAERFRDAPDRLVFESVNEPQFSGSSGDAENAELLHELNTSFHEIVRGSGGRNDDRLLVLPSLHTSADQARLDELMATFDVLDDPNLIATVHYYGYWPFSVNVAGGTRFDEVARDDMTGMFQRVRDTFVARGIPVVIGEYGLLGFDRHTGTVQQGEKLKFFELFGHYARTHGVTTMLWDNGQHFHRTGFTWNDAELFGHIESSWRGRSGTASSDQVFSERSAPVTDQRLTLNLNGTRFTGLSHDGDRLRRGTDYVVQGNELTLRARLLARLDGDREYGTNAQLTAHFSKGEPWRIDLITYDRPVLADASGTTDAFAVPTDFRGDRLATMEAVYEDGTNAGPHNWTPFKEFDVAFAPDYAGGSTTLTPAFFAEVADGRRVTLTFHYWSGATVTYDVVKSGNQVTGTVA
ncbi:cellulase family glycosylhydrolase [Streptomyces marincola]|uniref:cellulase family glycosylhydrolase n=1 Tax=Streptomyces marincola TaxID=2878388 RepID=UPI001CF1A18D|nr:cellulase family glycosylhydrolase [Streptomyces marincola]UCM89417.1 cellulase family glycosylhydrolase [Streptomyces marincola]